MTVDERLQFLLQSTESLHSSVHEVSATVQQLSSRVDDLTGSVADLRGVVENLRGVVENLRGVVEIDADNIRRLANIAAAHDGGIEDLGARLDRLEGRGKKNN